MNKSVKEIPNSIILLLAIFLPFSAVGFYIGNLHFSISFIPFIFLTIIIFLNGEFKKTVLPKYLLFISVCFISSFGRYNLLSFVPSLTIFAFLLFPFVGVIKNSKVEKYIFYSFILLSFYCMFELVIGNISPQLIQSIEKILQFNGSSTWYKGIRRLRGGVLEPSVLGLLLNFYLLIFIYSPLINKIKIITIVFCLIWIILTFSSTAYIGLIFNFFFGTVYFLRNRNRNRNKNGRFKKIIIFSILAVVIFSYLSAPFIKAFEKIYLIPTVLLTGNVSGSVGYRIHSITLPFEYILESDLYNKLLGTGFSNYSEYISYKYYNFEFSPFLDGSIGNIFSAILLSTGVLGFISFLFLFRKAFFINSSFLNRHFYSLIALTFLSYGDTTAPWIWSSIFLTKLCLTNITTKA